MGEEQRRASNQTPSGRQTTPSHTSTRTHTSLITCKRYLTRPLPVLPVTLHPHHHLSTLRSIILGNAALRAIRVDTMSLRHLLFLLERSTVKVLLEDGLLLNMLELGLEIIEAGLVAAAIGSTTGVGQVEAFVLNFLTTDTPM